MSDHHPATSALLLSVCNFEWWCLITQQDKWLGGNHQRRHFEVLIDDYVYALLHGTHDIPRLHEKCVSISRIIINHIHIGICIYTHIIYLIHSYSCNICIWLYHLNQYDLHDIPQEPLYIHFRTITCCSWLYNPGCKHYILWGKLTWKWKTNHL